MADERDEVRSRIDIVDLVSREGIRLRKVGKNYTGLCPFHPDKRPSFYVTPETGRYKCWSCGEAGDVFTWVMKRQNVDFVEALRTLAKEAGVTLSRSPEPNSQRHVHEAAMAEALAFFRDQFERSTVAQEYCAKRGLDPATLAAWEIGYAPDVGEALAVRLKRAGLSLAESRSLFLVDQDAQGGFFDKFRGRLIFPIRDEKGGLVAFGGRLLGDGHPKYINSGDTPLYRKSRVLYGMHRAREVLSKERRAVLVEGYLDVIACHRAGVTGALASLGTALAEEHAKLLRRWCDEVTILYDSDEAGQKAAARSVEVLRAEGLRVRVALMPPGDDPDTLLRTQGAESVQRAVREGLSPLDYRIQAIERRLAPEQEEFWAEVVDALAEARDELELARHVDRLAPRYPGIRDVTRAEKALRQLVTRTRRRRVARGEPNERPVTIVEHRVIRESLTAAEMVVFRAFLSEEFRRTAWVFARATQLFETRVGVELSQAIGSAFASGPPEGPPSAWLDRIEPDELRQSLSDILLDPRGERLSETFVSDSVVLLRERFERRQTQQMRQEGADPNEVFQRIRQRKPDSLAKPRDDDDLY